MYPKSGLEVGGLGVCTLLATCICSCGFHSPQRGAQSEERQGGVEALMLGLRMVLLTLVVCSSRDRNGPHNLK